MIRPTFNIRVYGICIKYDTILCLYETYAGEKLVKLPGGGLEYGEGTIECLKREFLEELSLNIKNIRHFYTQEDFITSRFRTDEQLFTIYYTVELEDETEMKITDSSIDEARWVSLKNQSPLSLPVDKIVFEKLKLEFNFTSKF